MAAIVFSRNAEPTAAAPDGAAPQESRALIQLDRELMEHAPASGVDCNQDVLFSLADVGDADALDYLHELFESFPERRQQVACALARYSQRRRRNEDWRLLVRSLNVVEGAQARTVLQALKRYPDRATKPHWLRQVILLGLSMGGKGAQDAVGLLEHWTGEAHGRPHESGEAALAAWQRWFRETYAEMPPAERPVAAPTDKWQFESLLGFLESGAAGDARRGAAAFDKAQCRKCHRCGGQGEPLGPDLAQVSGRMQRKEILLSVLHPSEYVSDQFQSYLVVTRDGRIFSGVVGPAEGNSLAILQPSGEKAFIARNQVETSQPSPISAMPRGTLDVLSQEEIADLFAYLLHPQQ